MHELWVSIPFYIHPSHFLKCYSWPEFHCITWSPNTTDLSYIFKSLQLLSIFYHIKSNSFTWKLQFFLHHPSTLMLPTPLAPDLSRRPKPTVHSPISLPCSCPSLSLDTLLSILEMYPDVTSSEDHPGLLKHNQSLHWSLTIFKNSLFTQRIMII